MYTAQATAAPGSAEGELVVSDIEAAYDELVGRGIEVGDIWHGPAVPGRGAAAGPPPRAHQLQVVLELHRSRWQHVAGPGGHVAALVRSRSPAGSTPLRRAGRGKTRYSKDHHRERFRPVQQAPIHVSEPKRWSVVLTANRWTDMATAASRPSRHFAAMQNLVAIGQCPLSRQYRLHGRYRWMSRRVKAQSRCAPARCAG